MKTGKKILRSVLPAMIAGITACSGNSVTEDLDAWCDCSRNAAGDPVRLQECEDMMKVISVKYEYDPDAVVIIQTKVLECK